MNPPKGKGISMIRMTALLLSLAALPAFAYTPPVQQQLDVSSESFTLRDGVVVDPGRSALYAMTKRGIEAIDLIRGEALWQSDAAVRPVGLLGDQLVALAEPGGFGRIAVVLLDARSGTTLTTFAGTLPDGATGWATDRPNERFQLGQNVAGGAFFMSWRSVGRPLQGAPVVNGEEGHVPTIREGTLRLDPAAGEIHAVAAGDAPQAAPFRFDLAGAERLAGVPGRQFRAGNDRHVLASETVDNSDGFNRYRWTFHQRADGAALGTIDRPVSTAAFFVADQTLVHEARPTLRRTTTGDFEAHGLRLTAVDLRSGAELWKVDLRDTAYHGILPP